MPIIVFQEEALYSYATEKMQEIAGNMPFCIQGSTLLNSSNFATHVVVLLDQGHSLLDQFHITFLKSLRLTTIKTSHFARHSHTQKRVIGIILANVWKSIYNANT